VRQLSTSGSPAYCETIKQIGFNAWHYADSNLWVSLGVEIFRQLAGTGPGVEQQRTELGVEWPNASTSVATAPAAHRASTRKAHRVEDGVEHVGAVGSMSHGLGAKGNGGAAVVAASLELHHHRPPPAAERRVRVVGAAVASRRMARRGSVSGIPRRR
jgi:hypothetical protein